MKNVEATTSALVLDKICKTSSQAPCWKIKMTTDINIAISNKGFQEASVEYQELLKCLGTFDETDRTILMMLGKGHSYTEIQEVVGDISMANLRVKANRARISLAKCMGRKL